MLKLIIPGTEYFDEKTENVHNCWGCRIRVRTFSGLTVKMGVKTPNALFGKE